MRVAIREQLAALVVFAVLIALAIVSIPTWIYVDNFVVGVESNSLALTASLKAAMIAAEVNLIQTTCETVSTRILIQESLSNYYNGSTDLQNFAAAAADLESAFSAGGYSILLQGRLFSRNSSGPANGLLNATGTGIGNITLPYTDPYGNPVNLGNTEYGYPPSLYPNITYEDLGYPNPYNPSTDAFAANAFPDVRLSTDNGLVLGPLMINSSFSLISVTIPIRSLNVTNFILGYMTIVATASSLIDIQTSREGLGNTGVVLLIGSTSPSNRFNASTPPSNSTYLPNITAFGELDVHFVLPPVPAPGQPDRHTLHNFASGASSDAFQLDDYPAALTSFATQINTVNNASATLSTTNEQGDRVAVGYARPQSTLINWTVIVEQDEREAYTPIVTLRTILLGCVFGTAGLILFLVFPCAHLSVLPIRRLKAATEKSIAPPGYAEGLEDDDPDGGTPGSGGLSQMSEKGFMAGIMRFARRRRKPANASDGDRESSRRIFKIPGKVATRRHCITDELTELTETFNEMSDELLKQYTQLDQKVAERTRELEISKKAAEAANESKTLFIANISHELKTPLNGIMGMCAVCMEEEDTLQIKNHLKTLYKSGDLLLHLLEDLLSFSKNQIGQQISLEEREFRLGDIRSQVLAIFDKQVRENKIAFTVQFIGAEILEASNSPDRTSIDRVLPAIGPAGTGRLKDMCLWGDQHRILQVIINLVSNSLKFTPMGGRVELRIRCVGEVEASSNESRTSSFSKTGSSRVGRARHRVGSSSTHSTSSKDATSTTPQANHQVKAGTALAINPLDPRATPHIHVRERSPTPPPPNAKTFTFEFEVEDSGPGIAEHMQQKIFEPFVQGDLGLSKKYGGTGLGLSICSQLASIMGGSITLKSTIGVGTTFTMQIPLKYVTNRASSNASSSLKSRPPSTGSADGDNPRNSMSKPVTDQKTAAVLDKQPRLVGLSQPFFAANPHPRPSTEDQMAAIDRAMATKTGQGRLRVLVADDNSTNIEVVSKMLKLEDVYDVTIATDGQEAYDLVKANMALNKRFDVIFMDIQMPNLNGLESTRLIRKMGYSAPIVALTAFSEESNVRECIESGMDEFLSKPIRRPALKQVLKKFATIYEEPETASLLTRRTTPEKTPEDSPTDVPENAEGSSADPSLDADKDVNGLAPPAPS